MTTRELWGFFYKKSFLNYIEIFYKILFCKKISPHFHIPLTIVFFTVVLVNTTGLDNLPA